MVLPVADLPHAEAPSARTAASWGGCCTQGKSPWEELMGGMASQHRSSTSNARGTLCGVTALCQSSAFMSAPAQQAQGVPSSWWGSGWPVLLAPPCPLLEPFVAVPG